MKIGFSLREHSLGSWIKTLILIKNWIICGEFFL